MVAAIIVYGERRGLYTFLVGKSAGKRLFGKTTLTCADNIKMDVQKMGSGWTGLIWLRIGTGVWHL